MWEPEPRVSSGAISLEWLVRLCPSQVRPCCSIVVFKAPHAIDFDKSVNSYTVLSCDSVIVVSDITCIRSIDPDWCIHVVFCSTLPFKVLPFRCVILKYPCLHVTPQHMFNKLLPQSTLSAVTYCLEGCSGLTYIHYLAASYSGSR
jgi:hypothetical protein